MVASADFDPVVVEPQLTKSKITELLTLKRESAKLDYKQAWNPGRRRDNVELTKDLVAMANTAGGYVVIGISDDGEEVGLNAAQVEVLDEADIRTQVQSFVGTAPDLFLDKTVSWHDKSYAIITILKSPRSPIVFEKDGQHRKEGATENRLTFRKGDVFVRHGSASERWNQEDVRTIYSRVVEREKERWLAEVLPDVRRLIEAAAGAAPPPDLREILHQDAESFERFLRSAMRSLA